MSEKRAKTKHVPPKICVFQNNPHLSQIGLLYSPLAHPLKVVVAPVRISLLLRQPHEAALKGGAV